MSAPPYMRLYWGDYFRKTYALSTLEHGAYLLLIGALWNNAGKIEADDVTLAKATGMHADEWAKIKGAILPFFVIRRGRLTHSRVSEELAKYESTLCKRKQAGKAGGIARGGKDRENPQANAKQMPSKSPHNQNHNQKKSSEDKSSGELPFAAPIPLDPDKRAWSDAVALLTERGRMTPAKARAFFGGMLKTHAIPAKDLLGAIGACIASGSQDPASYLAASAKAKGRSPPGGMVRDAGFV